MAIFLMILAGSFVSLSNLFMRKSIDQGGTTKGFLVFQMAMAFIVALMLNPVRVGDYSINSSIVCLGIIAGIVLASMGFFLGRSLEKGPPGVTFSMLSSATVVPAIIMAFFFGVSYGFPYKFWHAVGSLVVLFGLFLAGRGAEGAQDKKKWIVFCSLMFSLHVALLVLFQWRALLLNLPHPEVISSFFTAETIQSQWFTPFMFLSACLVQTGVFLYYERRRVRIREASYGLLGGLANGTGTYFMIRSTEVAGPFENALIFPLFSVTIIALSNLWSQRLYAEKVNWRACQFCALGLILGMVDWKTVAAFIGL